MDPDVRQTRGGRWRVAVTAGGRRHRVGIYDDARTANDIARRVRFRVGDHPQHYDCIPTTDLPIGTWHAMQKRVTEIRAATRAPRPGRERTP